MPVIPYKASMWGYTLQVSPVIVIVIVKTPTKLCTSKYKQKDRHIYAVQIA